MGFDDGGVLLTHDCRCRIGKRKKSLLVSGLELAIAEAADTKPATSNPQTARHFLKPLGRLRVQARTLRHSTSCRKKPNPKVGSRPAQGHGARPPLIRLLEGRATAAAACARQHLRHGAQEDADANRSPQVLAACLSLLSDGPGGGLV